MTITNHLVRAYLLLLLFFPILAYTADVETHHYLESIGSKKLSVKWIFETGVVPKLTWLGEDETIITWHNPSLESVKWLLTEPKQNTRITVRRNNSCLVLKGILKNSIIEKKIKIDNSPWFQSISLSLRPFLLSNNNTIEFWTLSQKTLKPYKLRAVKESTDVLLLNNKKVKTQKIKIRLTGILSVLGNCYYWFTYDDGVFIKYEGPPTKYAEKVTVVLQ